MRFWACCARRLGQLVLGVLELLDQPGQLALATVLDRIDQVANLVACGILPGTGGTHLVLFQLVGGLAELAGGPLLLALIGRFLHRRGRQGVGLLETLRHIAHPLEQLLQSHTHLGLPRCQVGQLGLLLGGQLLDSLADGLGLGRRLGRLLHGLLLLLEQLLGVFHDPSVGLELAEIIQHLLELVGDRLLIGLGLGQCFSSGIRPGRTVALARLGLFGSRRLRLPGSLGRFASSGTRLLRLIAGLALGLIAGLALGLIAGLALGLIAGLALGLIARLALGLIAGLALGLIAGLAFGLIAGLAFGLIACWPLD